MNKLFPSEQLSCRKECARINAFISDGRPR